MAKTKVVNFKLKADIPDTNKKRRVKKIKFLKALFDAGGTVRVACRKLNYGRATVYEWRKNDDVFADEWDRAVEEAEEDVADEAEGKLREAVRNGNITAIIFTLKSKRPKKWAEKHFVAGEGGGPIRVRHDISKIYPWLKRIAKEETKKNEKESDK